MSDILATSDAASLALHAMGILAASSGDAVSVASMSETLDVSAAHLSKVMQRLSKAGLVTSVRGPHGGYVLARSADTITLLDVYEAVDGPITVRRCLLGHPVCGKGSCPLGDVFDRAGNTVRAAMSETTLEEFGGGQFGD